MARSYVILSVVALAFLAIQMNQMVLGQGQQGPICTFENKNGTCINCPIGTVNCCDKLSYAEAKNGTVWTLHNGHCSCCPSGQECRRDGGVAWGITTNTDSDATAYNQACERKTP